MSRRVWANGRLATMASDGYGLVEGGALCVESGLIRWLGPGADLPVEWRSAAIDVVDLYGRLVTPGLIDCHTHLVYAGDRTRELEQRLHGARYEDVSQAGGGILATVRATRAASEEQLIHSARRRLRALITDGVTTIEIKSGYGLTLADELKLLRVARRLGREEPVRVVTTFLGAHTLPPEFAGRADAYISYLCDEVLPAIVAADLCDAVDVFCERIAFSPEQAERLFLAAQRQGLPVKIHAEQLSNQGAAALAARFRALSADHLEHLDEAGAAAMAQAGTVAVLLPGASYFLRESQRPPIELLRQHHVPMAVATDHNPGTAPLLSLRLAMNMACTLFRLTPEEALLGATRHAARALGLSECCGTLAAGLAADFAVWDVDHPAELSYWMGGVPLRTLVRAGEVVSQRY